MIISDFSWILEILVGSVIGCAIGVSGVGGGALIQPALIHILKIPTITAVGTGLLYASLTKIWGSYNHIRIGNILYTPLFFFLLGGLPATIGVSIILNQLSHGPGREQLNHNLQLFMALVLLFSAFIMFIIRIKTRKKVEFESKASANNTMVFKNLSWFTKSICVTAGIIVGMLIGATSVGGGVLAVPFFLLILQMPIRKAIGSSILVSLALSLGGGSVFMFNGNAAYKTVILMSLGSTIGVTIGTRMTVWLKEKQLHLIMITLVTISGISLLFKAGH